MDFLKHSWTTIEAIVSSLTTFKEDKNKSVHLFQMRNGKKSDMTMNGDKLFLRASVEYSNPQMTVEEVQGVIAARFIEACGNYFAKNGLRGYDEKDVDEICETLAKPQAGRVVAFLLNTDDVEPDRYSMNPLKESIVTSGQSAFPSVLVETNGLAIDRRFAEKYRGSLISSQETEMIASALKTCGESYMDMVDAVKYGELQRLSEAFGIDLCIPTLRMPISPLQAENSDGLLHYIIKRMHADYSAIEYVYECIGRSMKNRTTLLTVPHSSKGYGSKRAAKGKIYFDGSKLKNIKVNYETTALYPNAIDPDDVSIAKADDHFVIEGDKFVNYDFKETPSSPQFFLYTLASPEDAVIWHGIGAFGASQLLKSYLTVRSAWSRDPWSSDLASKYGTSVRNGPQFNLVPEKVWFHPVHRNIDASIGTIENLKDLVNVGMRVETLQSQSYIRN
jgi:hypothetical protein